MYVRDWSLVAASSYLALLRSMILTVIAPNMRNFLLYLYSFPAQYSFRLDALLLGLWLFGRCLSSSQKEDLLSHTSLD
jgi:hypothetical protein